MQLTLWFSICVLFAVLLRKHPSALVGIAIAIRVAVPSVASAAITGTSSGLTPASYFVLAAAVVVVLRYPKAVSAEIAKHFVLYLAFVTVFAGAAITTAVQMPAASLTALLNTLGCGMLLFLIIRVAIATSAGAARHIALSVVAIGCAQSALAIAQWSTGEDIFWTEYLDAYYWYNDETTRVMGTTGSWLDLGVLLSVCIPLAASVRNLVARWLIVLLLVAGVLLSQGRVPLVIAAIGVMYLIIRSAMSFGARVISVVTVAAAVWALLLSDLAEGVLGRNTAGDVSVEARALAFDYVLAHLPAHPWHGTGFGSSYQTRDILISSFENSYLMYAWDLGVFLTLVFVVALSSQVVAAAREKTSVTGAVASALSCAVLMGAYSGFATSSAASWLFLSLIALCAPGLEARPVPTSSSIRIATTHGPQFR